MRTVDNVRVRARIITEIKNSVRFLVIDLFYCEVLKSIM